MDLRSFRESRGISQAELAKQVGLKSKGYVCDLEKGRKTTIETALRIQKWSNGQVPARTLLPPEKAALLPDTPEPAQP